MSLSQILASVRALDGVLELAPTAGDAFPEIAWGDHFFYFAPDGVVPPGQPHTTIITKDYPDDTASRLDPPGRWRLNIHVGATRLAELVGDHPVDPAEADTLQPHPLYAAQGWVSIVVPGPRTTAVALDLVAEAHAAQRRRRERRG